MKQKTSLSQLQSGFTLIELMVVIVIIAVVASLVVFNVEGVDQRKAMQAREVLMLDLKQIQRESSDQGRIYALKISPASDVSDFKYALVEYHDKTVDLANPNKRMANEKKWTEVQDFSVRTLPSRVSFNITAQEHQFNNATNTDLIGRNAPDLIWLGNGETKPVAIQMYYDQKPVGELIRLDYLGQVSDEQQ
ncbi:prepilin-type N-terminal cleavage/methylation domain-containing protein [Acinetobacter sp. TY2]|uniref:prepilin-type N-terminal cleavage/methylation domain-containing protein n=1 Tax=Acinetobacter sp. TY2 TaxID=3387403 RepID=UPI003917B070